MSILGGYLDWQLDQEGPAGFDGFISAYVRIDGAKLSEFRDYLVAQAGSIDPLPDPFDNVDILADAYEIEMLNEYIALPDLGDFVPHAVIEIKEKQVLEAATFATILPTEIRDIANIIFLGSRHNTASTISVDPAPPTPGTHERFPTSTGKPICGFIDEGIGFLNKRFSTPNTRDEDFTSRFIACWMQAKQQISSDNPLGLTNYSGYVLTRQMISALLSIFKERTYEPDIYKLTNRFVYEDPLHTSTDFSASHGTHVGDICCGANSHDAADPMHNVDILAVQLPSESINSTAGLRLEVNILQAVRWIVYMAISEMRSNPDAGWRPLVINISLGITAGDKKSHGFLETYLKEELRNYKILSSAIDTTGVFQGCAAEIVLAFGNDRRAKQIGEFELNSSNTTQLVYWRVQPDDRSSSYLELRPKSSTISIQVRYPGQSGVLGPFDLAPGTSADITLSGKIIGRLYREPDDLLSAPDLPPVYILAIRPTGGYATDPKTGTPWSHAPSGRWEITVSQQASTADQWVSVQVQRGDTPVGYRMHGRQSYLSDAEAYHFDTVSKHWELESASSLVTRKSTHSSIASASGEIDTDVRIISVGASVMSKNAAADIDTYSPYTGDGASSKATTAPTKPQRSADGDDSFLMPGVLAAGTLSGTIRRLSGTSASAPQVTRARLEHYAGEANFQERNVKIPTVADPEDVRTSLGDVHISHIDNPSSIGRRNARMHK